MSFPPSSIPIPRAARRPSYASVVTGQTASSNPYHTRHSLLSNTIQQPPTIGTASHSYPAPQPFQHQHHRSSDAAEFYGTQTALETESLDKPFTIGDKMSGPSHASMEDRMSDFFIPSYMKTSRYIERLEEQCKAKRAAQAQARDVESRSRRSSRTGSLSTKPSRSSLNLQRTGSVSHRGVKYDVHEKAPVQSDDSVNPLPLRWNGQDKWQGIETTDGLEVKYIAISSKNDDAAASIRTDSPVPRECGIYYYEIALFGRSKNYQIALGFSDKRVRLDKLPGLEAASWAYHSDSGSAHQQLSQTKKYGPTSAGGDTIGCGINLRHGHIFFTRNGVHLGAAFAQVKFEALYPSVGLKNQGEHIKANFGQAPFVFDIDGYVARERATIMQEIDNTSLKREAPHGLEASGAQAIIAQYLAHEGFTNTARAFDGEVRRNHALLNGTTNILQNATFTEEKEAIQRQRIRQAILDGDIQKALDVTNTFFPSVLPANRSIYFKLRCRMFIELIRKCAMLQPRSQRSSMHAPSIPNLRASASSKRSSTQYEGGYNDVFDSRMELDETQDATSLGKGKAVEQEMSQDSMMKQHKLTQEALQYGQTLRAEFQDTSSEEEQKTFDEIFALWGYSDARVSSIAHLLDASGREVIANQLNSAILVGIGKASASAVERLVQLSEVLVADLAKNGGSAALLNVRKDYMSN